MANIKKYKTEQEIDGESFVAQINKPEPYKELFIGISQMNGAHVVME